MIFPSMIKTTRAWPAPWAYQSEPAETVRSYNGDAERLVAAEEGGERADLARLDQAALRVGRLGVGDVGLAAAPLLSAHRMGIDRDSQAAGLA